MIEHTLWKWALLMQGIMLLFVYAIPEIRRDARNAGAVSPRACAQTGQLPTLVLTAAAYDNLAPS